MVVFRRAEEMKEKKSHVPTSLDLAGAQVPGTQDRFGLIHMKAKCVSCLGKTQNWVPTKVCWAKWTQTQSLS
jgi:hypothetical protein